MEIVRKILFIFILSAAVLNISCSDGDSDDDGTPVIKEPVSQARSEKRGVSFSFQLVDDVLLMAPGISWSYNWGPDQSAMFDEPVSTAKIDFCPMAWNGNFDANRIRSYKQTHPECEYLLAFNEPNLTDQAHMTPQQAAQYWPELRTLATELGMKLISPAMNYGTLSGYSDPIKWLDEFFTLVPISDIDGISIHCYMASAAAAKSYIERFKKYDKPIWMTEFCAWEGNLTPASQMKYMCDIINYMESDPDVARYAWFIPRGNGSVGSYPYMFLLTKSQLTELTDLGKVFVNMSTQDKNVYYVEGQTIEAEHYNSISISEGVGTNSWVSGPSMQPTTDGMGGTLELCNFFTNQWVEYQIEVFQTKSYTLDLRYASFTDSEIDIGVNGTKAGSVVLPKTGEEYIWTNQEAKIQLSKGKHKLRLKLTSGRLCLNWLKVS